MANLAHRHFSLFQMKWGPIVVVQHFWFNIVFPCEKAFLFIFRTMLFEYPSVLSRFCFLSLDWYLLLPFKYFTYIYVSCCLFIDHQQLLRRNKRSISRPHLQVSVKFEERHLTTCDYLTNEDCTTQIPSFDKVKTRSEYVFKEIRRKRVDRQTFLYREGDRGATALLLLIDVIESLAETYFQQYLLTVTQTHCPQEMKTNCYKTGHKYYLCIFPLREFSKLSDKNIAVVTYRYDGKVPCDYSTNAIIQLGIEYNIEKNTGKINHLQEDNYIADKHHGFWEICDP